MRAPPVDAASVQEHDSDPGAAETAQPPRWRRTLASLRGRIVAWYFGMLVLGVALVIATVNVSLLRNLDDRIDRELWQEAEEIRSLARGSDPETGEPFAGDVERIFEVFLDRNVPVRNEVYLTFVDGTLFRRSTAAPVSLFDLDPSLAARWGNLDESRRARVNLDGIGRVEYLGVLVRAEGSPDGVIVVAHLRDLERAELDESLRNAVFAGLLVLLIAVAVAWNLAGRVLQPIRQLTVTARTITDSDLSRRIPVRGADEVSVLASTFNRMLARLETAFASQRSLLDDVGHELRTPITIIRGHLELLDHGDPDERAETVKLVVDELDRMHRMAEDLLLLAKAEQPDFLNLEIVDLESLTREVLAKAQGLAPRSWQVDAVGRARIVADRQRLTQALTQLCHNAVQQTVAGDRISVGSAVEGHVARLWVRDCGPGVPAHERKHIFDRFVRGTTGRGESRGAGLGLSIVRAIVEAHHGRVEVEAAPGSGATFILTLPIEPKEQP
jgi:two-component system, OmpR family, sensor kinase